MSTTTPQDNQPPTIDPLISAIILGQVRAALTGLAGTLIALGAVQGTQKESFVTIGTGIVMYLIGAAWSAYQKKGVAGILKDFESLKLRVHAIPHVTDTPTPVAVANTNTAIAIAKSAASCLLVGFVLAWAISPAPAAPNAQAASARSPGAILRHQPHRPVHMAAGPAKPEPQLNTVGVSPIGKHPLAPDEAPKKRVQVPLKDAQANPLLAIQTFSVDDLMAALADANAQTPPDKTAAMCYEALIPIVQTGVANPLPAGLGVFQALQKARDAMALVQSLQSSTGPLADLNIACAPLAMSVNNTLIQIGIMGGGIAASGGLTLPFTLPALFPLLGGLF